MIKFVLIFYYVVALNVCFGERYQGMTTSNSSVSCDIKTQLMDVDFDCQLMILERLNFESLVNVSQVNAQLNYAASYVFKRRYKDLDVVIANIVNVIYKQWIIENGILTLNYVMAEGFLKGFGHLIKRLHIQFDSIPPKYYTKLGYFVSKYCSESLEEIVEYHGDRRFLSAIQKPFKRVQKVYVQSNILNRNTNLKFSELFPEMRYLCLDQGWSDNDHPTDYHYPNLIGLRISADVLHTFNSLFKINPHIRLISCDRVQSTEPLKVINDHFPELEYLTFDMHSDYDNSNSTTVNFKHVKEVFIRDFKKQIAVNSKQFHFEKLEILAIEMDQNNRNIREWIEFILKHRNISSFIITRGYIDKINLFELSTQLIHLKEAFINCYHDISVEDIATFARSNIKMKKLTFKMDSWVADEPHEKIEQLDQILGNEWIIFYNGSIDRFNLHKLNASNENIIENDLEDFEQCNEETFKGSKLVVLLKKANINENCSRLARNAFAENYSKKTFAIHSPSFTEPAITDYTSLDTVHIYDIGSAVNLLKTFGDLITKLYVSCFDSDQYKEINDLIGKHCSESLTEIHFGSFEGNMWNDTKEPFNNVRKLSIGRTIAKRENEMTSLDTLFPNIQELHLDSVENFDDTFVEQMFPSLVNLSIKFAPYNVSSYLNASDAVKLINKNPQIRSVEVNKVEIIDYLDEINQVGKFAIKATLNESHFERFSKLCPNANLTEVSLECGEDVNDTALVEFIKNNEKLIRVHLKVYRNHEYRWSIDYNSHQNLSWHFNQNFKEWEWNITHTYIKHNHWNDPTIYLIDMERLPKQNDGISIVIYVLIFIAFVFICGSFMYYLRSKGHI